MLAPPYKIVFMKLHNYFRSSASFRVRIALNLKGLSYDYVSVHLGNGEHLLPSYKAADTFVPMLEVDGAHLSQSMAIMEYLDESHPEPPLLPADALGRAKVRALAQSVACDIHPLNNLRVLKYLASDFSFDEAATAKWYRHWCEVGLLAFERQLALLPASKFCWGDAPTMADCCLVPQIFNARRFDVDVANLPRVKAVFDACMALPAFERAQPDNCAA